MPLTNWNLLSPRNTLSCVVVFTNFVIPFSLVVRVSPLFSTIMFSCLSYLLMLVFQQEYRITLSTKWRIITLLFFFLLPSWLFSHGPTFHIYPPYDILLSRGTAEVPLSHWWTQYLPFEVLVGISRSASQPQNHHSGSWYCSLRRQLFWVSSWLHSQATQQWGEILTGCGALHTWHRFRFLRLAI